MADVNTAKKPCILDVSTAVGYWEIQLMERRRNSSEFHIPIQAFKRFLKAWARTLWLYWADTIKYTLPCLLRVGEDGHTASLFTLKVLADRRLVLSPRVEQVKDYRNTFFPALLNRSHNVFVLATGQEKSTVIAEILSQSEKQIWYPVKMIQTKNGKLVWLLDTVAAIESAHDKLVLRTWSTSCCRDIDHYLINRIEFHV